MQDVREGQTVAVTFHIPELSGAPTLSYPTPAYTVASPGAPNTAASTDHDFEDGRVALLLSAAA